MKPRTPKANLRRQFVKDAQESTAFDGVLWVANKQLKKTSKGKPYLDLELADKTGAINGKIWDEADQRKDLFDKNDFVLINAQVESYDNRLQLKIVTINRVDQSQVDLTDFIPQTPHDIELLLERLNDLCETIKDSHLARLVKSFLQDNSFMDSFRKAPAAVFHHQAYLGGLLEHTVQVMNLAVAIVPNYPGLDKDLLLTGAFLHDIGKIKEYELRPKPTYTDEGRLVGHTVLGILMLKEKVEPVKGFPDNLLLKLQHMILSHHGRHEYGAPALPAMPEAMALHYLDNIDADLSKCQQDQDRIPDESARWSEWAKTIYRKLYRSGSSG